MLCTLHWSQSICKLIIYKQRYLLIKLKLIENLSIKTIFNKTFESE